MALMDATSVPGSSAGKPPPAAGATLWRRLTGQRNWWRLAAQPVVLAACFVTLAVISATSIIIVARLQSNADLLAQALRVEISLANLRADMRSAESRARAYLISGDPVHRIEFRRVAEHVMPAYAHIRESTADNSAQQSALDQLSPLIAHRLDRLRRIVSLSAGGEKAEAIEMVRSETGNSLMDEISAVVTQMTREQRRQLELQATTVSQNIYLSMSVNLAGIALIIALAGISVVTMRRMGAEALHESEARGRELQAAVEELDAFSYSVSHDLRTPLRAVDGFSRILLKHHATALTQEAHEYLQAVRDNTVQMGHLVDDLLAFARLNRKQVTKEEVKLSSIVNQVVAEVRRQTEWHDVKVTIGDLPAVWGDASLLKQVFVNLIDNAFKYSCKREDAAIDIGACEIGGESAVFVRDNGVGFDMQYTDKLFGVFQRLHRAEDFEGTGVGLAIVQRIVHRHGWRVWAEAAVDKGATFYFTTETYQNA